MKPKVCIFCQFTDDTANGILMRQLADEYANEGYDIHLIYHPFKYDERKPFGVEKQGSLKVFRYYSKFFKAKGMMKFFSGFKYAFWDFPLVLKALMGKDVRIFHKAMPVSVVFQMIFRFFAKKKRQVVILDDWEGVGGMVSIRHASSTMNKVLATWAEEYGPVLADAAVCRSKIVQQKLELDPRMQGRTMHIPNGSRPVENVCVTPYKPEFRVCYVGTFKSRILIDFLIAIVQKSLELNPKLQFTFVGGGDEFSYLEQQADAFKENLILTNMVPHQEVYSHLSESHVALLYLNDQYPEAYLDAARSSTKLFEYLALGKAVVSSRHGEPGHLLIHEEDALLCNNVPIEFAQAIQKISQDKQFYENICQSAIKSFETKYSSRQLIKKFVDPQIMGASS